MPKPPDTWPNGALPRRMARELAAYYVGVSPNTFDRLVEDKAMPAGIRIGARIVWDRVALDLALDAQAGIALQSGDDAEKSALDEMFRHGHPQDALRST